MAKPRLLIWEQLEARLLRAAIGLPWGDPTHLTLSFAPDGTPIAGVASDLFKDLDARFSSPTAWQNDIVRAFQTWAARTNISIGLVADDGAPFGVAGRTQGDPRFGDIRIGARPLSPEVMAITAPPKPFMSGTLSGDMILNSAANLNPSDLFDVSLHEAGLALGLEETTDSSSVMYPVINPNAALSPGDVRSIQALYGTRAPDPHNNTIAAATPMPRPAHYLGSTPLVAYGNLATAGNTDFYSVQPPAHYTGPVTIQLQTSGISFMQPEVQVFDQNFKLLGAAQSSSDLGDIVTVQLPSVPLFEHYYVEVSSPATDVFGVGRYALSVTYDGRSVVNPSSLSAILRGPFDSLSAGDMAALLRDHAKVLFHNDLRDDTNETFANAEPLSSQPGYPSNTQYTIDASLYGKHDIDVYRIQAPQAPDGVLTVSLAQMRVSGTLPAVAIYDQDADPVNSTILLNGNGTYVVQATGLTPGAIYYLRVSADPDSTSAAGNYSLSATFGTVPAVVQSFVGGTLSASELPEQSTLYIAVTQLFQFVLSSSTDGAPGDAEVKVTISNSAGVPVFSLTGRVGDTVSGPSVLLTPGAYQVSVSVVNTSGNTIPSIAYHMTGGSLTDPIGPTSSDPVEEPMYPCPGNPAVDCYCYPDGTYSTTPYEVSPAQ